MTYHGRVTKSGTVLLDDGSALAAGTRVAVRPVKKAPKNRDERPKARRGILKYAGKAKGLPADSSRNVDHYLYGHPKR